MEEAYEDAFEYEWRRRGLHLLNDQTRQFEEYMFPPSVVGAGGWDLPNWVQDYEKHWQKAAAERYGTEAETAERHEENARKFSSKGASL